MYARVVTNQIQPGKMDEWAAIVRDSIVPSLGKLNGFQGFVVLTNHGTGKSIGYSVWETEADLEEQPGGQREADDAAEEHHREDDAGDVRPLVQHAQLDQRGLAAGDLFAE